MSGGKDVLVLDIGRNEHAAANPLRDIASVPLRWHEQLHDRIDPIDHVHPSPESIERAARAFRKAALVQWQPGETLAGYTARADAFMSRLLELEVRGRPLRARTGLGALLR